MANDCQVHFTRAKLDRLKVAQAQAIAAGQTEFTFEGREYLVSYARYLIEYLEGRLR